MYDKTAIDASGPTELVGLYACQLLIALTLASVEEIVIPEISGEPNER